MTTPNNPPLRFKEDVIQNGTGQALPVSFRNDDITRLCWLPKGGKTLSMKDMLRRDGYNHFTDKSGTFDSKNHNLDNFADFLFDETELATHGITKTKSTIDGGTVQVTLTKSTPFEVMIYIEYLRGIAKGSSIDIYFKPQDKVVDSTENLYKIEMNGNAQNGFSVHTIYGSIPVNADVREVRT